MVGEVKKKIIKDISKGSEKRGETTSSPKVGAEPTPGQLGERTHLYMILYHRTYSIPIHGSMIYLCTCVY